MNSASRWSVCVFCGSRPGVRPAYSLAARALGHCLGQRGARLVYGGGQVGLMGEVADAALSAGGEVIGVIPRRLQRMEVGHTRLTKLHVVETMHDRKRMMAEQSQAFIALPGGIGTLEEFFEVWTWKHLGYHDHPIGLLNVDGFFDPLLALMANTCNEGFVDVQQNAMVVVESDPNALLDRLTRPRHHASGALKQL